MNSLFKFPPKRKEHLTQPNQLAAKLAVLVGTNFNLTYKSRTDGSNMRKLVARALEDTEIPEASKKNDFNIIPPKGKGIPKILLEYIDTYIVTSGTSYNLQVWNRNPSSESTQIEYTNGETLKSNEVRFILVKVNPAQQIITSVVVLSPDYIVRKFGSFGKPTVKHQLIISGSARTTVLNKPGKILFYDDDKAVGNPNNISNLKFVSIHDAPEDNQLLPLSIIKKVVQNNFIGKRIAPAPTKNRGQILEEKFARALGYSINKKELLAGGFPDIRNQALEVKIQDSPTVDFGLYSPEYEEHIPNCTQFTTQTIRYIIALTNAKTNIIEGAIVCPGKYLGKHFTYVADKSYKCQRSIPMSFFENLNGKSTFNP